ncbi:MAG: oligosaccharide flippase family protein [Patescibacteria group bacterium]|nr:oligosaccharide flippase family protein [Patescibacteria group bacterium]
MESETPAIDIELIKKRAVTGVVALTSRTMFLQIISLAAFSLLSVFLSPAAIGIYIAVTAIMRIINFFTDFGFGAAIVQKHQEVLEEELATAFTLQMLVTLTIFLFFWFGQSAIASFFHLAQNGRELLLVLIFTLFLSSFKTIPAVLLERHLKFDKVIIPQIVESLFFNVIVVVLAFKGWGVSSYTWSTLISALAGIPAYYLVFPWKPHLQLTRRSLKMLSYGIQFQAKSILGTIKDDLLTTFLAKILPFSQLGFIGWGQKWAFFSFRFLVDSITKVTFSAYSRFQHDVKLLRRAVEISLFVTSFFLFPILSGLILTSSYFIKFIPHYQKWEPALFSLYFFSLNAAVSSLSNILVNTLDATGRVKTTLKLMVFWTTLTWILTPLFIYRFGYNGVAAASFLVTLTIVITIYLVKKIVDFSFWQSIQRPFWATMFMSLVVFIALRTITTNLITLLVAIIIGMVSYAVIVWFLARDEIIKQTALLLKRKQ